MFISIALMSQMIHPYILRKRVFKIFEKENSNFQKCRKMLSLKVIQLIWSYFKWFLTVKRLGALVWLHCGFSKNVSSKERVKSWFFVTFNIIISYIFPENFIEIAQRVQKIWRISLSILAMFINFHQFFGFFGISLLQKN